MARTKATQEQMNSVVINGTYEYTNPQNYTTKIVVKRVSEFFVFFNWATNDVNPKGANNWGWKDFSKYALSRP